MAVMSESNVHTEMARHALSDSLNVSPIVESTETANRPPTNQIGKPARLLASFLLLLCARCAHGASGLAPARRMMDAVSLRDAVFFARRVVRVGASFALALAWGALGI